MSPSHFELESQAVLFQVVVLNFIYFQVWTPDRVFDLDETYEAADLLGIPFVVIVDPVSVENGIVRIRDRETCWFEQIHASRLTQRMVKIFQDRFVEDTWTKIMSEKKVRPDKKVEKIEKKKVVRSKTSKK